jgi:hypothetical protein
VYFYELHEGDDDLMSDVILACETEVTRDEFFDMVRQARATVEQSYEADTLIEGIAAELERTHGLIVVSDDRLVAAVRIAADPDDDRLIGADEPEDDDALDADGDLDDEFDDDDELREMPDYVAIPVEFDPGTSLN